MSWTTSDMPSLVDRVAVVTGGNGGLGLETVKALAGAGAHVVMAARNREKADQALAAIVADDADASVEIVDLDLASQASVRDAAQTIMASHSSVDILMNNAGVMAMPEGRTADGFETQFGVNHLGHWTLTAGILPALLASESARVVTVTSTAHHFGSALDPENPHLEGTYSPWKGYGQSKLANYHFAIGLQREFEAHDVAARSLVAHPGLSHTNLQVHTVEQGGAGRSAHFFRWLAARTGMPSHRGALPQLRAATDPAARGGEMYAPRFVNAGPPVRRPILRRFGLDDAIATLWQVSADLTGVSFDFESAR